MIVSVNDDKLKVALVPLADDSFTAIVGTRRETVRIYQEGQTIFVHDRRGTHALTRCRTSPISARLRKPAANCGRR